MLLFITSQTSPGIVVGVVALLGVLGGIVFLLRHHRLRTNVSGALIEYRRPDTRADSVVDITSLAVLEELEEIAPSTAAGLRKGKRPVCPPQ